MGFRLSDAWLDELRSRVPLEEVVSEYVPLKQKGRRFWGCCPFHREKTPSFSVDTESQMYYCFGCHKGGTVIQFVMEMERFEFMDSVRFLAERVHMQLPETSDRRSDRNPHDRITSDERERIYEANTLAARFFHSLLWSPEGAEALAYFYKRGLNDGDIRRFGLGAAPKTGNALLRHLNEAGYPNELLVKAGLAVRRDNGVSDMFFRRAMFPIINQQGRVVGFGGRIMGDGQPKYLNTAETPVFNKRQGLYCMNMAKKERELGHLILVEGYMDTVSLRRNGIRGVVATLGTALTEEQVRLFKRFTPEVWISYDGDGAGQKAALRALDMFDNERLTARVIDYPKGMDPDDFVKAYGRDGFEGLPRYSATDYRMLRARDGLDMGTQEGNTEYAMRCCVILRKLKDPIVVENYVRRLTQETGYDRETLLSQIGVQRREEQAKVLRPGRQRGTSAEKPTLPLGERVLITLLGRGSIPKTMVTEEDFNGELARLVVSALLAGRRPSDIMDGIEDEGLRNAAAEALNYSPIPEEPEAAREMAAGALREIRRTRLNARLKEIEERIATATPQQKLELYTQIAEISNQLNEL